MIILIFKYFLLKSSWDQVSIITFKYIVFVFLVRWSEYNHFQIFFLLKSRWDNMSVITFKYLILYLWWGEVSIIIFEYFFYFWWGVVIMLIFKYFRLVSEEGEVSSTKAEEMLKCHLLLSGLLTTKHVSIIYYF